MTTFRSTPNILNLKYRSKEKKEKHVYTSIGLVQERNVIIC